MKKVSRLLMAALLAGCAGCFSSGAPDSRAWLVAPRTDLPQPAAPEGGAAFAATRLGVVNVCAPYDRAPFVIRRADGSVAFDAYNVFASAPNLLLRAPVRSRLQADGRFGHVVASSSAAAADAQVEVSRAVGPATWRSWVQEPARRTQAPAIIRPRFRLRSTPQWPRLCVALNKP